MMQLQSTSHWQPSYTPEERHRAVDSILIIWPEILLYTIYFERLAKLMSDNRVVIGRSLEALISNFDIVVILIMWIASLVRAINDVAIWYSEIDRQLNLWTEQVLNACMSFYIGFERVAMRGFG